VISGALLGLAAGGYYLYVRVWTTNFHTVVEGQVYRSAQPSPKQLLAWSRQYRLKTVINLRGTSSRPFYQSERQAAREAGLRMIDIRLSAASPPSALWIRRLIEALETAERPLLLHCRDGADRTGVASVIAKMAIGGQSYATAKKQLSAVYLHLDSRGNRIVELLEKYEKHCRDKGLDTDGWKQFRSWAMSEYHPGYYRVEIKAPRRIEARCGQKITADVRIRNRSDRTIPAADPAKQFTLAVFLGSSEDDAPDRELGPRTALPRSDIAPGQAVQVEQTIVVPEAPGTYEIHFDLIEEGRTWFARQGSPAATCELIVE